MSNATFAAVLCAVATDVGFADDALGTFAGYLFTDDNVRGMMSSRAESLWADDAEVNISGIAAVLRSSGEMEVDEFESAAREELASEAVVTAALSVAAGVNFTTVNTGLPLATFQALAAQVMFGATDAKVTAFAAAAAASDDAVESMVIASQVDLESLSMNVTDVTALVKEQIASFNADATSLDAALAALAGASGLEIPGTDLNIAGTALSMSVYDLSALLRSAVAGSDAGSVRASAVAYMSGATGAAALLELAHLTLASIGLDAAGFGPIVAEIMSSDRGSSTIGTAYDVMFADTAKVDTMFAEAGVSMALLNFTRGDAQNFLVRVAAMSDMISEVFADMISEEAIQAILDRADVAVELSAFAGCRSCANTDNISAALRNVVAVAAPGAAEKTAASASIRAMFLGADGEVGRCMLTVSKPELKARMVSALETKM
jgi:hypothetical protein